MSEADANEKEQFESKTADHEEKEGMRLAALPYLAIRIGHVQKSMEIGKINRRRGVEGLESRRNVCLLHMLDSRTAICFS